MTASCLAKPDCQVKSSSLELEVPKEQQEKGQRLPPAWRRGDSLKYSTLDITCCCQTLASLTLWKHKSWQSSEKLTNICQKVVAGRDAAAFRLETANEVIFDPVLFHDGTNFKICYWTFTDRRHEPFLWESDPGTTGGVNRVGARRSKLASGERCSSTWGPRRHQRFKKTLGMNCFLRVLF